MEIKCTFQYCIFATLISTGFAAFYISNLTPACVRCLCVAASKCNVTISGCLGGFCGPFQISEEYWRDADSPTLFGDNSNRTGAFYDCSQDYTCSKNSVENYIINFGKDCNDDGVTDCDDYAMLHFNLKGSCSNSIANTNFGERYLSCRPNLNHEIAASF